MADARRKRVALRERHDRNAAVPACWTWPINEEAISYFQGPIVKATGRWAALTALDYLLNVWQMDRCGVCGRSERGMPLDHDHETGWVRGYLCGRCNRAEGVSSAPIFQKYRVWHPASIFRVGVLYYGPWIEWAPSQLNPWDPAVCDAIQANGGYFVDRVLYDETETRVIAPRWHLYGGRHNAPCPTADRKTHTCACPAISA